jgi:hypothetical protein
VDPVTDRAAAAARVAAWLDARPNYGREDSTEQPIIASLPAHRGHLHLLTADVRELIDQVNRLCAIEEAARAVVDKASSPAPGGLAALADVFRQDVDALRVALGQSQDRGES